MLPVAPHNLLPRLTLRYPLIIDPSGQATEFIMNEYKDRKITRTSFLDDAFRKNLESALRFGNPLLVQVCAGALWSRLRSELLWGNVVLFSKHSW